MALEDFLQSVAGISRQVTPVLAEKRRRRALEEEFLRRQQARREEIGLIGERQKGLQELTGRQIAERALANMIPSIQESDRNLVIERFQAGADLPTALKGVKFTQAPEKEALAFQRAEAGKLSAARRKDVELKRKAIGTLDKAKTDQQKRIALNNLASITLRQLDNLEQGIRNLEFDPEDPEVIQTRETLEAELAEFQEQLRNIAGVPKKQEKGLSQVEQEMLRLMQEIRGGGNTTTTR